MIALTTSQKEALKWLTDRGGDGVLDKWGIVLAAGETAPYMRTTWNRLREAGKIEFYGGAAQGLTGYGRIRIVK